MRGILKALERPQERDQAPGWDCFLRRGCKRIVTGGDSSVISS